MYKKTIIIGSVTSAEMWFFQTVKQKSENFVKKAYQAYFGVKLGDQDKPLQRICRIGETRKRRVCRFVSKWCEGKAKITLPTAIFAWQI